MVNTSKQEFKAAVLFKQNEPLRIVSLAKVEPSDGQVGIRMISASLCGAQWNEITGVKGPDKFLPHMMGHEGVGEVVSIGPGVTKVRIGDIVILHWRKGSGCDCFGPKFTLPSGLIGSGSVTTFSEYTVVAENRVTPIKYNNGFKHIYPLVGCALSTSWGVLAKEAMAKRDQTLFVCGAGGIGITVAFWAKVFQLKQSVFFDRVELKRPQIERLGGKFYSIEKGDSIGGIKENFDIVIDTTGNVENISACFDRVKSGGKLILVGQPRVGSVLKLNNPLRIFDGIKIFSSDGGQFSPDTDVKIIIDLLESNTALLDILVSHVIRLEDVNEGFRLMQAGEATRVVIDFEEDNL
jgi:S-(hydroxymethyl)glutathione dehydrogenase / alcohol dehydrogenase